MGKVYSRGTLLTTRVRSFLICKFSSHCPFASHLPNRKTSQAVIREAMRVHPSNCYPLERVVPEGGTEICGYFVPQGTVVSMMAPVVNKAPSVFGKDADAFRPERWLEADKEELKLMDRAFFTVSSPLVFPYQLSVVAGGTICSLMARFGSLGTAPVLASEETSLAWRFRNSCLKFFVIGR